jgi:hypothetical protein
MMGVGELLGGISDSSQHALNNQQAARQGALFNTDCYQHKRRPGNLPTGVAVRPYRSRRTITLSESPVGSVYDPSNVSFQ